MLVTMALPGLLRAREGGEGAGQGLEAAATGVNRRRLSQHTAPYTPVERP